MTYTHDRTYWRACATKTLIEAGLRSDDELAIALAERLEEYDHTEGTVYDLLQKNMDLDRQVDNLMRTISELNAEIEQLRFAAKF